MFFVIKEEFANAVMKYLSERPFVEVHQFIAGFQDLKPLDMHLKEIEDFKSKGEDKK